MFYFLMVMSDRKHGYVEIHKHLCDDREFLTEMLGKQSDLGDISSHESDISASDSNLDCSGLVSVRK